MSIFYIADTHFGHDNIRRLSKRPFANVEEMDEVMIRNWNSVVTNNDDVYILGDFSFKSKNPAEYLKRLNGKLHLITGNHDKVTVKSCRKYFVEICDMKEITDGDYRIVLCHYPLVEWNGYYGNTYHFYGHVHNTFHNATTAYAAKMPRAFNVGADILGFIPKKAEEIINGKC